MSLADFSIHTLLEIASAADTDTHHANLLLLTRDGTSALLSQILNYTDYHPAPLLWSVMHRFHPLTLLLLETDSSIDVNARTVGGLTALHIAVLYGDDAIVELLLEHESVEVEARDFGGGAPLYFAVEEGRTW